MELKGARILVTGGARGLGRQYALDLARAGARVGICDMNAEGLQETASLAQGEGFEIWTSEANVADEAAVEKLFADFVGHFGGIDGLVNNAGIMRDGLFIKKKDDQVQKMSMEQWQSVIDVNLTGTFLCGREAAYHMVSAGTPGVIVNISSLSRAGNLGQTNYVASKAGVAAIGVTWAKELARYGIRVGVVAPGYARTEMTAGIREDIKQKLVETIPLRRFGEMDEISLAIKFVFENDFFTGRVIEVDGGARV
jgi:3-oxoacyl-[acyl-carrier protein] reductase